MEHVHVMDQVGKPLSISQARGKLPELARYLSSHPDQVVLVEHRDLDETLAVTTLSHLRYLETQVRELKKQAARPFRLAGSIASRLSDDELERNLAQARRSQAEEDRRRAAEFCI